MNNITLPTREMHARYLDQGLTAFGYEEIEAAHADVWAAFNAYDAAYDAAVALYYAAAPHGTWWTGWEASLPEAAATLMESLAVIDATTPVVLRRTNREAHPVRNWQAGAKKYRACTKRLAQAVAAYHKQAAQVAA